MQAKQYLSDLPKSAILTFVSFIVMMVFPPLGIVLMTRWSKFARLKVVSYVLVGFLAVWLLFICQMLREGVCRFFASTGRYAGINYGK